MRKEKIIAGVLGIVMLAGLSTMGFVIWNATRTKLPEKQAVKSVKEITSTGESSLSVGNNSGLGGGLNDQAQSLGSNSSSPNNTETKQKTEDFSQYEKYKDAKNALFGEIKAGTGAEANANSKVAIYYVGRFTDGKIFDQSRPEKEGEQPKALEFVIGKNQVIAGMEQGVAGMKVGGARRIIIPPAAGYGEKGYGPVPPNAVMIFDVELRKVD